MQQNSDGAGCPAPWIVQEGQQAQEKVPGKVQHAASSTVRSALTDAPPPARALPMTLFRRTAQPPSRTSSARPPELSSARTQYACRLQPRPLTQMQAPALRQKSESCTQRDASVSRRPFDTTTGIPSNNLQREASVSHRPFDITAENPTTRREKSPCHVVC